MGRAESSRESSQQRSACTECSRRKQKCNREWPCNHCQKRKVADRCRFRPFQPKPDKPSPPSEAGQKRQLSDAASETSSSVDSSDGEDAGLEALGYSAAHHFSSLTVQTKAKTKAAPKQYFLGVDSSPQLKRALQLLPPRPCIDALVQNFLQNVNFRYYIIYPQSFLEDYHRWCTDKAEHRPLGLQWTCLLLMACACSAQCTTVELEKKLTAELGQSCQKLTERYHNAARELHSVIPVGHSHLLNVQHLLLSSYWFKSEGRFVECWHVLNAAVREAQELGLHQESAIGPVPEFDLEMRRRVWCLLDSWDWQISTRLGRPMIIDRSDCDVCLPSLALEGYSPSPLLHMKMQSDLIRRLSKQFGQPKHVTAPETVRQYQTTVEKWMSEFPSTYDWNMPDRALDDERPWIIFQRYYLHTTAYSTLLDPMRAFLAKPMSRAAPAAELQIRTDGVNYALNLMKALYGFFNHVYPRDPKYHFVLFAIFDTSAVLCSALLHDRDASIARREDMTAAIQSSIRMLQRLSWYLKSAKMSHQVLSRLAQKVLKASEVAANSRKRPPFIDQSLTPPPLHEPSGELHSYDEYAAASAGSHSREGTSIGAPSSLPPSAGPCFADEVMALPPADVQTPPRDRAEPRGSHEPLGPVATVDADGALFVPHVPGVAEGGDGHDGALPSACMQMAAPATMRYGELGWLGISEEDVSGFAELWNYERLDLNFLPLAVGPR